MAMSVCLHLEWANAPSQGTGSSGAPAGLAGHCLPPNPSRRRQLPLARPCGSYAASAPPGLAMGRQLPRYYEVLTAPISKVSAGSSGTEPPAAPLAACEGAAAHPTPSLVLSFSPGPDPGSVV